MFSIRYEYYSETTNGPNTYSTIITIIELFVATLIGVVLLSDYVVINVCVTETECVHVHINSL